MPYDPRKSSRYQQARARFKAVEKSRGARCAICGREIDWQAPARHPNSWTLDHIKPVDKYPELALDPANFQSAHWSCNARKADKSENVYSLGKRVPRLKN